jgi:hypothetical protein
MAGSFAEKIEPSAALAAGRPALHDAAHLCEHVIDDFGVLVLRAEHDDFGVLVDLHRVSGRPMEQVAAGEGFFAAIGIRDGDFALHQVAPVRRLAQVALQPPEQRRDVGTGRQREILAADLAVAGGVAEVLLLTRHGARHIDPGRNIVLCDSHCVLLFGCGRGYGGLPVCADRRSGSADPTGRHRPSQ